MILALLGLALAGVELTVEGVGGPVTQSQRLMLQSTLQRVSGFYRSSLGVRLPSDLPMRVVVYHDRTAFEDHRTRSGAPLWADGWFRLSRTGPETVLWAGDQMRPIFLHEASHYLTSHSGPTPRWLNEGLAQVLETATVRGNALTVRTPPHHAQILASVGRPTVVSLITHPGAWNELPSDQAGPLYIQGWALTALLLSNAKGQETIRAILAAWRTAPGNASTRSAIEQTYPGGLDGLEAAFARWRPDASFILPSPIQVQPTSTRDTPFVKCDDGRLVNRKIGCGRR